MFRFHFKVFIKTLLKSKLLTIINVSGLVIGFAVSILVWAFVNHELSYDNSFNEADRICRVIRNWQGSEKYETSVSAPLAQALVSGFPEIIATTRLYSSTSNIVVKGQDVFREDLVFAVDSSFFAVFGIDLIKGNPEICLKAPGSAVLSRSAALRLFGSSEPLGRNLLFECSGLGLNNENFTVTGVYDNFPVCSHMRPDFLLSSSSFGFIDNPSPLNHFLQVYVLLELAGQKGAVENKLPDFMKDYYGTEYYEYSGSTYLLQGIKDIHLNTGVYHSGYETPKGSYMAIYIFPALALFIILISMINFVNLHTSQSLSRRKEIWMKKVSGASSSREMALLVMDSVVLFLVALIIAVCVIEIFFPSFEMLVERQLDHARIFSPVHIILGVSVAIILGILSGLYPAMVLISAHTLKDQNNWREFKTIGVFFNSKLIILQFALCIFFLCSSIFIYKQFKYMNMETNRGFNKENILLIKNPWYLGNSHAAFKEALLVHSGISEVTSSESVPGIDQFSVWGHPVDSAADDAHITVIYCDYDYASTLNLKLIAGRFFSRDYSTDNLAMVLNKAAADRLGWDEPIGKRYRLDTVYHVIGVIQDIHYVSLHSKIEPMGMVLIEPGSESFISMRIRTADAEEVLSYVNDTWNEFVPDRPVELSFMNREFDFWYRTDRKIGIVTALLSILAVAISCLGLLGLMVYTTIRRTREIGIRKVTGASTRNILYLFLQDTSKWLLAAFVIAIPLSWLAMNKWLQGFAYRTEISWWIFLLAGITVYTIAIGTIIWQSIKVARHNPAESLRYE